MPDPTPGQRAWTIYTRVDPLTFWEEWDKLHAEQRQAWEAVGAARLAAGKAPQHEATPRPNPTPGQVAYGMYQRRLHNLEEHIPLDYPRPFAWLSAAQKAAWAAAAQAVLAQCHVELAVAWQQGQEARKEETP